MGLVNLLFGFKGRIGRRQYWLGCTLVGGGAIVASLAVGMATGASVASLEPTRNGAEQMLATLAAFAVTIAPVWTLAAWSGFALQVKRFHDRGRTGLWTLLPFVPATLLGVNFLSAVAVNAPVEVLFASISGPSMFLWLINLGFFIDLGCLPGASGANKYGDPPGAAPAGASPPSPAPIRPGNPVASSLASAEQALERAIADRARGVASAAPSAPSPAKASATPPSSFGRRAAH